MLAKRIIACLDVKGGRVVKGVNFSGLRDAGEPVQLGGRYCKQGADEIVFLDIAASGEERKTRLDWVRKAARRLDVPFTVGGGISSLEDIRSTLLAGADKVSLNTAAVLDPLLIKKAAREFGSQCIVAAIDAKLVGSSWKVFVYAGRRETGLNALEWARECESLGAGEILLTSIDRDGTGKGFDLQLTRAVSSAAGIPVIASGGAGFKKDFLEVLTSGRADAALAAGVFHYGRIVLASLKNYLLKNGVPVRLVE